MHGCVIQPARNGSNTAVNEAAFRELDGSRLWLSSQDYPQSIAPTQGGSLSHISHRHRWKAAALAGVVSVTLAPCGSTSGLTSGSGNSLTIVRHCH